MGFVTKAGYCRRIAGHQRFFLKEEQKKQFALQQFAEVKAGEAIFHHSLTLHGSGANTSSKPRRAFVINAIADGVVSDSNETLLDGVPPVPKGEKIQGQFFPLLYTPGVSRETLVRSKTPYN